MRCLVFRFILFLCVFIASGCQEMAPKSMDSFPADEDIEAIDPADLADDYFLEEEETASLVIPIMSVAADTLEEEDISEYSLQKYKRYTDAKTEKQKKSKEEEIVKKFKEEEAIQSAHAIHNDRESAYLQPISLDFKGATLREVIRAISAETNINFILPDRINNNKVYISLKNVPWDQALQAILQTNGLGIVKLGGDVVRIDTLDSLAKEKKDVEEGRKNAALVTPTKVLVVRLSYAKAATLVKIVNNMLSTSAFDKRVKVDADERTNAIVVEAIPQELSKISALIKRIDLQTPQVRIESRVIEIQKTSTNSLGINWATPFNYDQGRGLGFGNLVFPSNIISAFSVDSGATSSGLLQQGKFDIHIGSLNNITALDLRLRMGELTDQTKSLQNNNVLVVDGENAKIQAGSVDYFQVPTGQGQTAMSSVEYLLSLDVTPHITADGAVQMAVTIENSAPTKPNATASTSKSTRTLKTSMLRKSGETAVIGGLYTTSYQDTRQGFPFLMDIPIFGLLFRSSAKTESKRELIILITPTIVSGNERIALVDKGTGQDNSQNSKNNSDEASINANLNEVNANSLNNNNESSNNAMNLKENSSSNQGNLK